MEFVCLHFLGGKIQRYQNSNLIGWNNQQKWMLANQNIEKKLKSRVQAIVGVGCWPLHFGCKNFLFSPSRPIAWRTKFNSLSFSGKNWLWCWSQIVVWKPETILRYVYPKSEGSKFRNSILGSGRAFEVWFEAL